jgi:hypothetical protein
VQRLQNGIVDLFGDPAGRYRPSAAAVARLAVRLVFQSALVAE